VSNGNVRKDRHQNQRIPVSLYQREYCEYQHALGPFSETDI
jgi:hypothetical protein